jgi:hypothetical protein
MIAADTSTWIAFLQGEPGKDVELLDRSLEDRHVLMAPPVLTELLSDPGISSDVSKTLSELPVIAIQPGLWKGAGALRATVLAKRRKAVIASRNIRRDQRTDLSLRTRGR